MISYFSTKQWKFIDSNTRGLCEKLSSKDAELFDFDLAKLDWKEYFYHHIRGLRVYLLNDKLDTIEEGLAKRRRWARTENTQLAKIFSSIESNENWVLMEPGTIFSTSDEMLLWRSNFKIKKVKLWQKRVRNIETIKCDIIIQNIDVLWIIESTSVTFALYARWMLINNDFHSQRMLSSCKAQCWRKSNREQCSYFLLFFVY